MLLTEILSADRIAISKELLDAGQVLTQLSRLLAGDDSERQVICGKLLERERLQSTGIGDGVAIPHTAVENVASQRAALVLCPQGVDFSAIDNGPVYIFFGVVGPKSEASAHLKILAKVSRLLRSPETRRRLLESDGPGQAYSLIEEHENSAVKL